MCVAVPLNEIVVLSTTDGSSIVGEQYRIFCTVLFPEGLTNPITVQWYGSEGLVSNGSGITIGDTLTSQSNITSVLEFSPFHRVHGGRYSCRAMLMTQAPPFNIIKTADIIIITGGESIVIQQIICFHSYVAFFSIREVNS